MSKRTIIDAHHHLWDLEACHYPWLMEKGVIRFFGDPRPIQQNYLVADFKKDASNFVLAGSVHIQVGVGVGDEVKESRWVDKAAESEGLPSALVGFCDLGAANASEVIDAQAGIGRLRGLRHIVGRSSAEDVATGSDSLLENANWVENLGSLRERNLSFDLQMIPEQSARVVKVLQQLPGLRVALCHAGSPWDQSPSRLDGRGHAGNCDVLYRCVRSGALHVRLEFPGRQIAQELRRDLAGLRDLCERVFGF